MNLVVIVSDTLRWDYLGAYGNDWIETPNLAALAAESVVYEDAFAEGLPTIPARRVIMTGRNIFPFQFRPQKSDMVQTHGWHPLYDEDVTLSEWLGEKGYYTAFVNDVYHMMKPGKNFHRGFDQWFWVRGQEADPYTIPDRGRVEELIDRLTRGRGADLPDRSWVIRHLVFRETWRGEEDTMVSRTMRRAADWLDDYTLDRPFYLHVECFDPHEPWDPPREYAERYNPDYGDSLDGIACSHSVDHMTPEQFANVKAAYAGEVSLVDRWVGHLLDALKSKGLMDDTIVVFTSDHGCMMGEQGDVHKGRDRLRRQVTQLPLFIRHPDAVGRRVEGFVQHQDIMPTVLAMMGEDVPDRCLGRNVHPDAASPEDAPDAVVSGFGRHACYRTAKWNYIRPWRPVPEGQPAGEQLYDLEADPQELTNVAPAHRDVTKEFEARLLEHIQRYAPLTNGSFQSLGPEDADISYDALPAVDG